MGESVVAGLLLLRTSRWPEWDHALALAFERCKWKTVSVCHRLSLTSLH